MHTIWTVRPESVESRDAVALLREYFAELTVRYFRRPTDEAEIDLTLEEFPSAGFAAFFVLRTAAREPAGCLGLYPTGELTRVFVLPEHRRLGGGRVLIAAAEEWGALGGRHPPLPRHPPRPRRSPRPLHGLRLRGSPALLRPGPVQGPLVREAPFLRGSDPLTIQTAA